MIGSKSWHKPADMLAHPLFEIIGMPSVERATSTMQDICKKCHSNPIGEKTVLRQAQDERMLLIGRVV
jgi:BarA-like signal transduction histidine kinase